MKHDISAILQRVSNGDDIHACELSIKSLIAAAVKAERERVIDEIETSLSATCRLYPRHCSDYDRCFINKNKCTTYLVQQLKQEG